jgi:carbon-monoxide dehydrogenase medium subunit
VQEALDLLVTHEDEDPVLYMGGTELLLVMKLGLAEPGHLIDGKGIADLHGIEVGTEEITIGAGTTHRELELDPGLREALPVVPRMARDVANVRVRNAGTLGGNLCFAEPHSDPGALLVALGAEVDLVSPRGLRSVPLSDFFLGAMMTALDEDEIMLRVRVRVPRPVAGAVTAYRRVAFRERPVVNVGVLAGDRLRVVVGAVGPRPLLLEGGDLEVPETEHEVDEVARLAAEAVEPIADVDGSEDYKRHLTEVTVERALLELRGTL